MDEVFAAPSLKSPEHLSKVYIEDFLNQQRLPLKAEYKNVYIFRRPIKTVHGVEVPLDAPRLRYSSILPQIKKVGYLLGMVNVIPYSLRYNAGARFDASGECHSPP